MRQKDSNDVNKTLSATSERRHGAPGKPTGYSIHVFESDSSHVVRLPDEGTLVAGRGPDAEIPLSNRGVSRRHAAITVRGDAIFIEDLGSANGTSVNGLLIDARVRLQPGAVVALHSSTLVLRAAYRRLGPCSLALREFTDRGEDEIDRASRANRAVTIACFRFPAAPDRDAVEAALESMLRPMDALTVSDAGELLLLLPELAVEDAFGVVGGIKARLSQIGPTHHIGFASFPTDGDDLESLLAEARSKRLSLPSDPANDWQKPFRIFELAGTSVVIADAAMLRAYGLVRHLARSAMPVLVTGETGTGKELVASALHHWSPRSAGPFVPINCAALTESLADAELFGHERGAFTGAVESRFGVFERANGGTVFLDEIAELTLPSQAKLLRVLETRRVTRVGGGREVETDFRIVAASNLDLHEAVVKGTFRKDLYHRLCAATVSLPPLRERPNELVVLAQVFLASFQQRGTPAKSLSAAAIAALQNYSWPGNIRELKHTMDYLVSTAHGEIIDGTDVAARLPATDPDPTAAQPAGAAPAGFMPLYDELAALEQDRITAALEHTGGNQTRAAALLSVPLRSLQAKIRRYRLGGKAAK